MPYLTAPIEMAIKATAVFGWVSAIIGGIVILLALSFATERVPVEDLALVILAGVALYVVPGAGFIYLAKRMETLAPWAFVATTVLCGIELLLIIVDFTLMRFSAGGEFLGPGCCALILRLPTLILAAACLNVMPDVRELYRQRKRDRVARGFEPVLKPPADHTRRERRG